MIGALRGNKLSVQPSLSKRLNRFNIVLLKRKYSFAPSGLDWWFGRGLPLHPYIFGRLVRDHFRPRNIRIADDPFSFITAEFAERTIVLNWMSQWCNYLRWYWTVLQSDSCTLHMAFSGPMLIRKFDCTWLDSVLV